LKYKIAARFEDADGIIHPISASAYSEDEIKRRMAEFGDLLRSGVKSLSLEATAVA
jgi:hypothetical protein